MQTQPIVPVHAPMAGIRRCGDSAAHALRVCPVRRERPAIRRRGSRRRAASALSRGSLCHPPVQANPPAPAAAPSPPRRRRRPRLFTHSALARSHAISAGALQLYSAPCTLCLLWQASHCGPLTPSGLELITVIVLSYIKDITSVPLALRHRRGASREAMLIAAWVDFAVWTFTLYLCAPFITQETGLAVPALPADARYIIFGALVLGGVFSTVRPICTAADVVAEVRRASPGRGTSSTRQHLISIDAATAALYSLVQAVPGWSVVMGGGCILFGGPELRQWVVDTAPSGYGFFYSVAFCGAAAGSLGVFSATLLSRRLISVTQMNVINAAQISVCLGFVVALYAADPQAYGEVLRVNLVQPFWFFNETPWLS